MIGAKLLEQVSYEWSCGKVAPVDYVLTTDSRKIDHENLFLCLSGERFDAFDYIEQICASPSMRSIIFSDKPGRKEIALELLDRHPDISFIAVKDSLIALQELAILRREQWQSRGGLIFSLSGSNGKTTTKEMLSHFLRTLFPSSVLATKGNLNNHIGVPLTLLALEDSHQVAVVEMGINHTGEMDVLCRIAAPNFGLITNIGFAHVEYLGGLSGVFKEKSALYRSIESSTHERRSFVIYDDDEYLTTLPDHTWTTRASFVSNDLDYFSFVFNQINYTAHAPQVFERHNRINMMLALCLVLSVFPDGRDELLKACETFTLPNNNRSQIFYVDNSLFYLDAYNANPSSMRASLESFKERVDGMNLRGDEVLLVLGDMNEIGNDSEYHHREIAALAWKLGFRHLVAIGRFSHFYRESFQGETQTFKEAKIAKEHCGEWCKKFRAVFIKGSRSLQLESLVDIK